MAAALVPHSQQEKQVLRVVIVSLFMSLCLCPKRFLDVPAHNLYLLGLQSATLVALF